MFPLNEKRYVFGFAPGDRDAFGWSICEITDGLILPQRGGMGSHAAEVMDKVVNYLHGQADLLAIGFGTPLFWSPTGTRRVDAIVREALTAGGHPTPSETVQHLGSVHGASLVQGLLLASSLWEHYGVPIIETHPKALAWLLEPAVKLDYELTEETPDAVLAAFAAWRMSERAEGWRDLYLEEPNPVLPLGTPVSYWLPIP